RAGFREIRIVDETPFPTEIIGNDATAKEIIEKSGIRRDEIGDLAGSVLSVSICGIKPKETM
ncbi:MAG: hypothetical protein ABSG74_13110, partial [Candidatus Bathyarchaeia archaeon]